MNSDDPEYPRYLQRNRLESDRKEALYLVNSIFDDRERYFEAHNDIDQETALKFVELGQGIARTAVGFDIPRIAFRHDQPESRDALKMVLRTFRSMMLMNLDPGDWGTTITTDSIDRWLDDLNWLDKGVSSPAFQPKHLNNRAPDRIGRETKITISLWLAYLGGLFGNREKLVKTQVGWLSVYFGFKDKTLKGFVNFAAKNGHAQEAEHYRIEGEKGEWPHYLAGENPRVNQLWQADFKVRWEAQGDDWEKQDGAFNAASVAKWREIIQAEIKEYLGVEPDIPA